MPDKTGFYAYVVEVLTPNHNFEVMVKIVVVVLAIVLIGAVCLVPYAGQ